MRKPLLILILFLFLTACSAPQKAHNPESYILGAWEAYQIEFNGNKYSLADYANTYGMEVSLTFEFGEYDIVTSVMQGLAVEGTYQFDGEIFAVQFEGEPVDVWLEGDDFVFEIAGLKYYLRKL